MKRKYLVFFGLTMLLLALLSGTALAADKPLYCANNCKQTCTAQAKENCTCVKATGQAKGSNCVQADCPCGRSGGTASQADCPIQSRIQSQSCTGNTDVEKTGASDSTYIRPERIRSALCAIRDCCRFAS